MVEARTRILAYQKAIIVQQGCQQSEVKRTIVILGCWFKCKHHLDSCHKPSSSATSTRLLVVVVLSSILYKLECYLKKCFETNNNITTPCCHKDLVHQDGKIVPFISY